MIATIVSSPRFAAFIFASVVLAIAPVFLTSVPPRSSVSASMPRSGIHGPRSSERVDDASLREVR